MKPEQKRIKIAECCGWKNADHPDVMKLKVGWTRPEAWCMDPKGVLRFNHDRPDYLNSLDAMAQARRTLTDDEQKTFVRHLARLDQMFDTLNKTFSKEYSDREGFIENHLYHLSWYEFWVYGLNSSAEDQADAFLKMKGIL